MNDKVRGDRLQIRLNDRERLKLERHAEVQGVSVSEFVRQWIWDLSDDPLEEERRAAERIGRLKQMTLDSELSSRMTKLEVKLIDLERRIKAIDREAP
jgi:hypothetical protein